MGRLSLEAEGFGGNSCAILAILATASHFARLDGLTSLQEAGNRYEVSHASPHRF